MRELRFSRQCPQINGGLGWFFDLRTHPSRPAFEAGSVEVVWDEVHAVVIGAGVLPIGAFGVWRIARGPERGRRDGQAEMVQNVLGYLGVGQEREHAHGAAAVFALEYVDGERASFKLHLLQWS